MTPKARKEKKGITSATLSYDKSFNNAPSTEFSFKFSDKSSPKSQSWMNKELILLMESKAVLERGFLSLKQAHTSPDAQDITSDTYVSLITKLFKTLGSDRKIELRDKLSDALNDESDLSL